MSRLLAAALLLGQTFAYDTVLGFNSRPAVETRTIDEIYSAALKEGGTVTVWHGGDEKDQQDSLKSAFEKRFPGMTLNITVDLSKYLDGELDQQLYQNNVYVDSIILQTLQDFPRWEQEGALLNYAPVGDLTKCIQHLKIPYRLRGTDIASFSGVSLGILQNCHMLATYPLTTTS